MRLHAALSPLFLGMLACASGQHQNLVDRPAPPECAQTQAHIRGTLSIGGPKRAIVEGIAVALIAEGHVDATMIGLADVEGQFSFCVPPGKYALTVTSSVYKAIFSPPRLYEGDVPLSLALEPGGTLFEGVVGTNEPIHGAYVRLLRMGNETGDIFFISVSDNGRYKAFLLPGSTYRVDVTGTYRSQAVPVSVKSESVKLDLNAYSTGSIFASLDDEAIKWLRTRIFPMRTTSPVGSLDDLNGFERVVGDAVVVGIGENSHGVRETFQLKHRLFRFLASNLGFNVFALEVGFADAFAINEYVHGATGDAKKLVADLGYWTWDTQEFVDLVEWMREFNIDPSHRKKVSFFGVDLQYTSGGYAYVLKYLQRVDSHQATVFTEGLAALGDETGSAFRKMSAKERAAVGKNLQDTLDLLDHSKSAFLRIDGDIKHWELARQTVVVLVQAITRYDSDRRDKAMADNLLWILEYEGPGSKAVLSAHDGHVAAVGDGWGTPTGTHLRNALGARYLSAGVTFGQGVFRAYDLNEQDEDMISVVPISVGVPPTGYVETMLHQLGVRDFMLDMRGIEKNKNASWFSVPHPFRILDAEFRTVEDSTSLVMINKMFDVLFYTDTVSASSAMPTGLRGPRGR